MEQYCDKNINASAMIGRTDLFQETFQDIGGKGLLMIMVFCVFVSACFAFYIANSYTIPLEVVPVERPFDVKEL